MAGCPQIECFTTNPQNEWLKTFRQQTNAVYGLRDGGDWAKRERTNDLVSIISDPKSIDPRVPESMDFTQRNYRSKKRKDFLERSRSKKIALNGSVATFTNGRLYDAEETEVFKNKFRGQIPDYMKVFPEYNAPIYNLAELLYRFQDKFQLTKSFETEEAIKKFFKYYEKGLAEKAVMVEARPLIESLTTLFKTLMKAENKEKLLAETTTKMVDNYLEGIARHIILLDETQLLGGGDVITSAGVDAVLSLLTKRQQRKIQEHFRNINLEQGAEIRKMKQGQRDKEFWELVNSQNPDDEYADQTGIQNDTYSQVTIVGDIRNIWANPTQLRPQTEQGYEAVGPHTDITVMPDRRRFGPVEPNLGPEDTWRPPDYQGP